MHLDKFGYTDSERSILNRAILYAYHIVYKKMDTYDVADLFGTTCGAVSKTISDYLPAYDPILYIKCKEIFESRSSSNYKHSYDTEDCTSGSRDIDASLVIDSQVDYERYELALKFANYRMKHNVSWALVGKHFGYSQTMVSRYVRVYLSKYNPILYKNSLSMQSKKKDDSDKPKLTPLQISKCETAKEGIRLMMDEGLTLNKAAEVLFISSTSLNGYICKLLPLYDYDLYIRYMDFYYEKNGRLHRSDIRRTLEPDAKLSFGDILDRFNFD